MKMRASLSVLFAMGLMLLVGCQRNKIPSDSFHVTVDPIIAEPDINCSLLTMKLPPGVGVSVDSKYSHSMVNFAGSSADDSGVAQIVLTSSRIAWSGKPFASVQSFIGIRKYGDSNYMGGTMGDSIPATSAMAAYFSVSITNGDYKLQTPIEIGRLDGKPITLTVGTSLK